LLAGKEATCYPGYEQHLIGARLSKKAVVQDGAILTGNGPGAAARFALQIVKHFRSEELAEELAKGMKL
jgi:protein deglycase